MRDTLIALSARIHVGSDGFAVKAEAEGLNGSSFGCFAFGRGEGRATGVVAALVAERLYDVSTLKPGVLHVEQLFDPVELLGRIAGYGISVDLGSSAPEAGDT